MVALVVNSQPPGKGSKGRGCSSIASVWWYLSTVKAVKSASLCFSHFLPRRLCQFLSVSQYAPVVLCIYWFVYILDFLAKICHVLYILQGKAVLRLRCQNISNELMYHSYPSLVITVQGVVGTRNCIFNSKWKREDTENWSLRSM